MVFDADVHKRTHMKASKDPILAVECNQNLDQNSRPDHVSEAVIM